MQSRYRKKRPLKRTAGALRDSSLVVIATEGSHTEKQYFGLFKSSRVQVFVLPTKDTKSSPEHVLKRMTGFETHSEIGDGDVLCLMLDVDRWGDKKLSQVCGQASDRGYMLAVSRPCFEVWLLCHFDEPDADWTNCSEVITHIRKIRGKYNKSNLDLSWFHQDNVTAAIERASRIDTSQGKRWPQSVGSHVYRVVEEILKRGGSVEPAKTRGSP